MPRSTVVENRGLKYLCDGRRGTLVFSSITFLFYFLPLVLLAYYISPKKIRNGILFFFSLVFYAWGEPVYVVLMFFSTLVDYIHGFFVDKYRGTKKAKLFVVSSVIINLGLLGIFKYSDFVIGNFNLLFGSHVPLPHLALPIGISFYTFQTMSYTIDVYRGDAKVQKNIISFGAYVALFPQLIAGPIVRYSTVAEQLDSRRENTDLFGKGISRFVTGLGKKVLLANNIGLLWSQISAMEISEMSVLAAWLGILAFSFQIYFDFSGYSDMAIGLGQMFGFQFLENFNYPYISKSITEFWRRWHISLGTWFKEYVYFPLGGNRKGPSKHIRNIAVVWLLTGIWHGASWNFLIWGAYYCVLLLIEKFFLSNWLNKAPGWLSHVYTLLAVLFGWVIFAFDSLPQGMRYMGYLFGAGGLPFADNTSIYLLVSNLFLLVILILGSTPLPAEAAKKLLGRLSRFTSLPLIFSCCTAAFLFLLSTAYLVDSTYNPFLYFRF